MKVEKASELLKVLADEQRLKILKTLYKYNGFCANDLLTVVDCKQATLSHHMSLLVESGFVNAKKDGNKVYYSVNRKQIGAVINFLSDKKAPVEVEEGVIEKVEPAKMKQSKTIKEVTKIIESTVKETPKVVEVEKKEEKKTSREALPTFLL